MQLHAPCLVTVKKLAGHICRPVFKKFTIFFPASGAVNHTSEVMPKACLLRNMTLLAVDAGWAGKQREQTGQASNSRLHAGHATRE